MLSPKKRKFKKYRKDKRKLHVISGKTNRRQIAYKNSVLTFGESRLAIGSYGLKAMASGKLTSAQIEACKAAMNRILKQNGQLWLRVFPDLPLTKKPTEVRMGKGKGNVDTYMTPIKAGRILFEYDGITPEQATALVNIGHAVLPLPVSLIYTPSYTG